MAAAVFVLPQPVRQTALMTAVFWFLIRREAYGMVPIQLLEESAFRGEVGEWLKPAVC